MASDWPDESNLQRVADELLAIGLYDSYDLSTVVGVVCEEDQAATSEHVRDLVLAVVRGLLDEHLVEVGEIPVVGHVDPPPRPRHRSKVWAKFERDFGPVPAAGEFIPWDVETGEALERIAREWRREVLSPGMGEVCWFRNTPKGDNHARQASR